MGEKLKPCPFCGKETEKTFDGIFGGGGDKCGCGHFFMSDKAWNTRAADPVKDALAQALRDLIRDDPDWKDEMRAAREALRRYEEERP